MSGSGKSTLINDTLFPLAQNALNRAEKTDYAPYQSIEGLEHFDKVIDINQSPIGRTPRSNPATYTGLFTPIRELFLQVCQRHVRVVIIRGVLALTYEVDAVKPVRATVYSKLKCIFLPDVYVPCDQCKGKRYNRETLEIRYKGKTIHQVLDMTVEEAREFLMRFQ